MDLIVYDFNPHFRKGSDSTERAKTDEPYDFNPHFRKGSDCIISRIEQKWNYFNPHFHKGSDRLIGLMQWGYLISIHTSTREVTAVVLCTVTWRGNFNPHFHKGSDSASGNVYFQSDDISIHTSTREVTAIFHKNICLFL